MRGMEKYSINFFWTTRDTVKIDKKLLFDHKAYSWESMAVPCYTLPVVYCLKETFTGWSPFGTRSPDIGQQWEQRKQAKNLEAQSKTNTFGKINLPPTSFYKHKVSFPNFSS